MDIRKELHEINLNASILGVSYFFGDLLEAMKSKGHSLTLDEITAIKDSTIKAFEGKEFLPTQQKDED